MLVRIAEIVGFLLIAAQVIGIARMPFVRDRFFCWSPHDNRTDYSVSAIRRDGSVVAQKEIRERYATPPIEWHATGNLLKVFETAERRKPLSERWKVTVKYRVNLGPEQIWNYEADR